MKLEKKVVVAPTLMMPDSVLDKIAGVDPETDYYAQDEVGAMNFGGGEELAFCCGIEEIGGFGCIRLEPTRQELAITCLQIKNATSTSTVLATTIPKQSNVAKILKAIGFQAIVSTTNPKTKNKVTLWQADIKR